MHNLNGYAIIWHTSHIIHLHTVLSVLVQLSSSEVQSIFPETVALISCSSLNDEGEGVNMALSPFFKEIRVYTRKKGSHLYERQEVGLEEAEDEILVIDRQIVKGVFS